MHCRGESIAPLHRCVPFTLLLLSPLYSSENESVPQTFLPPKQLEIENNSQGYSIKVQYFKIGFLF
jgi:hypothetical protein